MNEYEKIIELNMNDCLKLPREPVVSIEELLVVVPVVSSLFACISILKEKPPKT
jgi:hypothetical protein